jgi:uroporphyrinogen-III synthase
VNRADLVRAAWGAEGDDHVLDVTIARLRRRLGAVGRLVETVPKRGYRISAEFV